MFSLTAHWSAWNQGVGMAVHWHARGEALALCRCIFSTTSAFRCFGWAFWSLVECWDGHRGGGVWLGKNTGTGGLSGTWGSWI